MRYFIDTEFIEDGRTIDLVSIALVCEDGREWYAESAEFDESRADSWVRENVLAKLGPKEGRISRAQIKAQLIDFVGHRDSLLIGYYPSYDHVVVCGLFGRMGDLPEGWPMWTYCIHQLRHDLGWPKLPPKPKNAHNALDDARWTRDAYNHLKRIEQEQRARGTIGQRS